MMIVWLQSKEDVDELLRLGGENCGGDEFELLSMDLGRKKKMEMIKMMVEMVEMVTMMESVVGVVSAVRGGGSRGEAAGGGGL